MMHISTTDYYSLLTVDTLNLCWKDYWSEDFLVVKICILYSETPYEKFIFYKLTLATVVFLFIYTADRAGVTPATSLSLSFNIGGLK